MKCTSCGHDGSLADFRYLYNPRVDGSETLRQCTKCSATVMVDELKNEVTMTAPQGVAKWEKSVGIV